MANYFVGLRGDSAKTMREALDLSEELATAGWNCYSAMALPRSEPYPQAIKSGVDLPGNYTEYSFHSYDRVPLGAESLTPAEVLKFRDNAFLDFHQSEGCLRRVRERFGDGAVQIVLEMNQYRSRRLVEEAGL